MKLEAKSLQQRSTDGNQMTSQFSDELHIALVRAFNSQAFSKKEVIQQLWSGYGEIGRYSLDSFEQSLIVKVVDPTELNNHPRGWNTQTSHQRKLSSYINERHFYRYYAHLTDQWCRVPQCLASGSHADKSWLIMEDLDSSGYGYRCDHAPLNVVRLGLRWLAHFHARFIQQPLDKVWPIGTYWHLKTRPDEWQKMPSGLLKTGASAIDQKLNQARFQTLVHGDAKLANFCFSPAHDMLAAVDFQYVGRGIGVKDIMYFLGSCFHQDDLYSYVDLLVDEYFVYLKQAVQLYQPDVDYEALESEWRELHVFAWADFERFLLGWMPSHHKLNGYSKKQTDAALSLL